MGHAYTVIGVVQLEDAARTKIIKIRNPHGSDSWKGPWADEDERWTQGNNAKLAKFKKDRGDGIIHMDLDTFMYSFSDAAISFDTTNMFRTHFMQLDEYSYTPGKTSYCGSKCNRQELTFTSDSDQTVYISANTWPGRDQPKACERGSSNISPILEVKTNRAHEGVLLLKQGAGQLAKALEVRAGETIKVEVEFDFSSRDSVRDWSVVAWATKSKLTVSDSKGRKTHSLPYIARQAGTSQPIGGGNPDPSPSELPDPKVVAGGSKFETEFNTWVNQFPKANAGCAGWTYDYTYDPIPQQQFVMYNNCGADSAHKFTVKMVKGALDKATFKYHKDDTNTKPFDCKDIDGGLEQCTFYVGDVGDWKAKG